ncbi:hypothetical protein ACP70R_007158 [Stipagrostis hirtigluma subsp. patula]
MELSTPLGSSLAAPVAMALVNPNLKDDQSKMCQDNAISTSIFSQTTICSFLYDVKHTAFTTNQPDRLQFASVSLSSTMYNFSSHDSLKLCIFQKFLGMFGLSFELSATGNPSQSSVSFKDFCVSVYTQEDSVIKIRVNVAGTLTGSTFDIVFTKSVAAAQPLPGFRRMKGGKTPDIPKEVALHLIGPSKVKKETIKRIINSTIAEYVQKEGLNASKNLKVQQSYEELEAAFEPGKEFCFDAAVHLQ